MTLEPAATLIGLREGLEAFLILGILLGLVVRLGHREKAGWVWGGGAAGVAVSVVSGVLLVATVGAWFEGSGAAAWFEIVAALAAIAILTYMVIWMWGHTRELLASVRKKVTLAAGTGQWALIGGLAFFTVLREGLETVLFFAALSSNVEWGTLLLSGLLGFGVSALIAAGIFRASVRFDLKRFFAVTGMLLVLIAAGLIVHVVHASMELGLLPHGEPLWDTSGTLPDEEHWLGGPLHAFIGYEDQPTALQLLLYLAYVVGVGGWYLAGLAAPRARAARTQKATVAALIALLALFAVFGAVAPAASHDEGHGDPHAASHANGTRDVLAAAADALERHEGKVGILIRDHGEIVEYNATTYQSIKAFIQHIWPYTGLPPQLLTVDQGTYFIDNAHPFDDGARADASLVDAWLAAWTLPALPAVDPAGMGLHEELGLNGHFYLAPGAGPGLGEGDLFELYGLAAYRDWLKMENHSPRWEEGLAGWQWLAEHLAEHFGDRVAVAFSHGHDPMVDANETMEAAARFLVSQGVTTVLDAYQSSVHSDAMNTCMMAPHAEHALRAAGFRGDIVAVGQAGLHPLWGEATADLAQELVAGVPADRIVSVHLVQHGARPGSPNPCGDGADQYHANLARQYEVAEAAVAARFAERGGVVVRHVYGQGAEAADDGVLSPTEALDLDARDGVQQSFLVPYEFWGNAVDNLVYLRESLGFAPKEAPYYDADHETHLTWKGISVTVTSAFFSTERKAEAQMAVIAEALAATAPS